MREVRQFIINGQEKEFAETGEQGQSYDKGKGIETLADLLGRLTLPAAFAVAVNGSFVPQTHYAALEIKDRDAIEIVTPHPGG